MGNNKFYIRMPALVFMASWLMILIASIILAAGPFFVAYLPSIQEDKLTFFLFPALSFFFWISPILFSLIAFRYKWISPGRQKSPSLAQVIAGCALMGLLMGWACSGVLSFPTAAFGRFTSFCMDSEISSIQGFHGEYSSRSWVAFGSGWFARRFLWDTDDLREKRIDAGDCLELSGKTLGAGIVINNIKKIECLRH